LHLDLICIPYLQLHLLPAGRGDSLIVKSRSQNTNKKADGINIKDMIWGFKIVTELGFSAVIPLVGGAFLGSFLDRKLHTNPKLTLSFIFIGLILGLLTMFRIVSQSFKNV